MAEVDIYKIELGDNTYNLPFLRLSGGILAGNIRPDTDSSKTLGTSNYKWSTVYADKFIGNVTGNADTATALGSNAGSVYNPIYFTGGKPTACTYSLNKTVPSTAVFTDVNVTNNTTTSTYYLCGSTSSSNATGTLVKRSTVYVNGSSAVYASGGFYESSDEQLKNFSDDIKVDLEKIKKLPKKYFTWKNDKENKLNIGTSAQELQKLYPEIVDEDENGMLSVAYDKLSVIALSAVDELTDKITSLEERLAKLESLLNI